jgi:hypothetical protein
VAVGSAPAKLHGFFKDVEGCAMTQATFALSPPNPALIKL